MKPLFTKDEEEEIFDIIYRYLKSNIPKKVIRDTIRFRYGNKGFDND